MIDTPQVVLLMIPFAGFDRGLLDGIARYAQIHGPWVFYLSGDNPEVPLPSSDSVSGKLPWLAKVSGVAESMPMPDLARWEANGIIGRIQTSKIARKIAATGLPVIGIELSREQAATGSPLAGISEIRVDSYKSGVMAAEHFLDRGFQRFAFCGYEGASLVGRSARRF